MAVSFSATCFHFTHQTFPPPHPFLPSQLKPGDSIFRCNLYSRRHSPSALRVLCAAKPGASIVTKDSWERSILKKNGKAVLVEFYASWCGPCGMVHRMIDEIAGEYGSELDCYVLNTDSDPDVAKEYEIKAVPVVLIFKYGQRKESIVGTMPKKFYKDAIDRVLRS